MSLIDLEVDPGVNTDEHHILVVILETFLLCSIKKLKNSFAERYGGKIERENVDYRTLERIMGGPLSPVVTERRLQEVDVVSQGGWEWTIMRPLEMENQCPEVIIFFLFYISSSFHCVLFDSYKVMKVLVERAKNPLPYIFFPESVKVINLKVYDYYLK